MENVIVHTEKELRTAQHITDAYTTNKLDFNDGSINFLSDEAHEIVQGLPEDFMARLSAKLYERGIIAQIQEAYKELFEEYVKEGGV